MSKGRFDPPRSVISLRPVGARQGLHAYLRAGLHTLPPTDLAIIARAPDAADLQSADGIAQVIATASALIPSWGHELVQHAVNRSR